MNTEEILRGRLVREQAVIAAMQRRQNRWLGPAGYLLWRKPWRSTAPCWRNDLSLRVNLSNLCGWLQAAHDCSDPSVGCSCSGGFRFP